jgi:hypothetical protein
MADIITHAPDQFTSVMLGVFTGRPDWNRVDTRPGTRVRTDESHPRRTARTDAVPDRLAEWLKGKSSFAARYFKLALEDVRVTGSRNSRRTGQPRLARRLRA